MAIRQVFVAPGETAPLSAVSRSDYSLALSARAIRRNCNAISTQQEQAMKALLAAAALTLIATTEVSAQSAS